MSPQAKEASFGWVVHQVVEQMEWSDEIPWYGGATVDVGPGAKGSGVDEEGVVAKELLVEFGVGEGVWGWGSRDESDVDAEFAESKGDGFGSAASAENECCGREGETELVDPFFQGSDESIGVGIVADESALAYGDAVDGTDLPGRVVQFVEVGDDGLLVRDGDVEASEVGVLGDELWQATDIGQGEAFVCAVGDALLSKFFFEKSRGERMAQWKSYEAVAWHSGLN